MSAELKSMPFSAMPELSYQISFGNMPHGTIYLDRLPDGGVANSEYLAERKAREETVRTEIKAALTTTSPLFAVGTSFSGTSGSIPVLLPTIVDPNLYDVTFRKTPLSGGLLPRVTNRGIFADYITRTVLPTAKWKAEGASLDAAVSTYVRAAKKMSYLYATGEINGPMLVASTVWQNALRYEQEGQMRALKELEEDTIINGNPTAGDAGGTTTDNNGFKGLIQSITTNTNNKSSATITLSDIRTAHRVIREARGEADLDVTDFKTLDDIKGLIQDLLRYPAPTDTIGFGIQNIVFEGVPIVPDLFMPQTANGREFLALTVKRENNIQIRVLQEATFEELAKTNDSYKFMIKEYLTMIIVREAWCYRTYNLA